MKIKTNATLTAAAAAALLVSGCRTIHGNRHAPDVDVQDDALIEPAAVVEQSSAAANATAGAQAPAQVVSADQVGTPGTYRQFVIADGEDHSDRSYAVEAGGLRGQTGKHVSPPPPQREPEPVHAQAPAGSGVYVVQSGDILGRIAQKHGVSTKALADANGIADPSKIRAGQKLKIPPRGTGLSRKAPVARKSVPAGNAGKKSAAKSLPPKAGCQTYVVKNGEILGRIAIKFKTSVTKLQELNGISDPTKLRAGREIYVPAASGSSSPAHAPARNVSGPATPAPAPADKAVAVPAGIDLAEPELPVPTTDGSYFAQ